jgi:hypothetical protein
LSIIFLSYSGNGKRHRTPTPSRLKKIKVVSFKAFLYLKGLLKDFRREAAKPKKDSKFLSRRAPTINDLETRIYLAPHKKNNNAIHYDYEPSRINNTRDSSFWQWRRVKEWYRYINDPIENINGHMIT